FHVELVAAEPVVIDPIAFDWDAKGRLWVVEMRDYPLGIDGKGKPGGVIKILEDSDGDGRYDKATPFLKNVPFPSGVMPWRDGALITSAPDIIFAEDTDGDGRADKQRPVFTGFKPGNQQHRVNGFEWGLDNWLYCANGDSGGTVKSIATGKTAQISGRDFAFQPETGEMRAIEGQTQFGRRMDDWGNWFGNNNPTWLWHYPTEERYIARNPRLAMKSPRNVLANYNDPTRVFTISTPMLRFNQPQSLNHVTSACSACPYRDDLFGGDFAESIFISEPVHNVVHREVVTRDGIRFHSRRADDEQASEFLASSDNWFRPTMLKIGPDGALYLADMYRFVLEHPEWIAPETQARLDLRAGEDKGRIYRVVPDAARLRPIPKLNDSDGAQLVAALESPNGWQRMTAQQLLIARRDDASMKLLREMVEKSAHPKARLHALCTLDGLGALSPSTIGAALRDTNRDVRRHALRLAERFLAAGDIAVRDAVLALRSDANPIVRHQLALSLGASSDARAGELLAEMLARDGADEDMRPALLSSAPPHIDAIMNAAIKSAGENGMAASRETVRGILALADTATLDRFVARLGSPTAATRPRPADFEIISAILEQVAQRTAKSSGPNASTLLARCAPFVGKARTLLAERTASDNANAVAAARCLGWIPAERAIDVALFQKLLSPQFSLDLQNAAVDG
ncbi:MAG TPA: PVC-type heme-binding CxxCH protein, partial [Chthoniobacteraceae bacterium]|nr:PVC-type heme-binding CxxCH protein [Chthoniobacteraceae bacterium]